MFVFVDACQNGMNDCRAPNTFLFISNTHLRRMSWRDPALGEKRENITSESELRELFRRAENNPDRKGSIVSNFWSCEET